MKLNLGRDSEARFGKYLEFDMLIFGQDFDSVSQRVCVYPEKFNIAFLLKNISSLTHMYSDSQVKCGTKTQCKIFHGGTVRGGHF